MVEWHYYAFKILNPISYFDGDVMGNTILKIFAVLIIVSFLFGCSSSPTDSSYPSSQSDKTFESFPFDQYKVEIHSSTEKAKINFTSNPWWKRYKTRLSKDYKDGNIDFGGYYITTIINCGIICRAGVMVDVRDGKIYTLPLGKGMGYAECYSGGYNADDDGIYYKPDSRLFITVSCIEARIGNTKSYTQEKLYCANVWDEFQKRFVLNENL